jgi:hypothetical protein
MKEEYKDNGYEMYQAEIARILPGLITVREERAQAGV